MATIEQLTGHDLRFMRRAHELPQVALATAYGVSRTRIQQIERQGRISVAVQQRYLEAFRQVEADLRSLVSKAYCPCWSCRPTNQPGAVDEGSDPD